VAALLAAEARPGDVTLDCRTPALSVKLSLPPPSSVTAASLAAVEQGSLLHARMVSAPLNNTLPPLCTGCNAVWSTISRLEYFCIK
jgi:hypothetical protein